MARKSKDDIGAGSSACIGRKQDGVSTTKDQTASPKPQFPLPTSQHPKTTAFGVFKAAGARGFGWFGWLAHGHCLQSPSHRHIIEPGSVMIGKQSKAHAAASRQGTVTAQCMYEASSSGKGPAQTNERLFHHIPITTGRGLGCDDARAGRHGLVNDDTPARTLLGSPSCRRDAAL